MGMERQLRMPVGKAIASSDAAGARLAISSIPLPGPFSVVLMRFDDDVIGEWILDSSTGEVIELPPE